MKCCIVSPFPPDRCGIALYAYRLVKVLREHCKITVIANHMEEAPLGSNSSEASLKIVRCWKRNTLSYPIKIFKEILREQPHLIHIQHEFLAFGSRKHSVIFPALLVLLKLLGTPTLITMHSVLRRSALTKDFFEIHGVGSRLSFLKRIIMIFSVKLICTLSNAVIVHNALMREVLIKDYRIPPKKIHVVPHGVELGPSPKLDQDKPLVAFIGFVTPDKGIETLLLAFSEVLRSKPSARLVIAGGYHPRLTKENPHYIGTIERLLKDLRLSEFVEFLNEFLSEEKLNEILSFASVIVLPYSEDRIIGSSGALASCAKFGKPVVATRIPRFYAELEDKKEVLLVSAGNSEELANAILNCLEDKNLREKLGKSLQSWGARRTWNKVAELTLKLYAEVARMMCA